MQATIVFVYRVKRFSSLFFPLHQLVHIPWQILEDLFTHKMKEHSTQDQCLADISFCLAIA